MGNVIKTVVGVALIAVALTVPGAQFLLGAGISLTASGVLGALAGKPSKQNQATGQRLSKLLDPEAFRKIVFGKTCGGADLRYWEVYGANDTNYDEVIAVAGHQINSFQGFWLEEVAVTFDGSGQATSAPYAGLLTREIDNGSVGNAALAVGAGSKWTAASKFRGSAHYALRYVYDQTKMPQGIPSRYTCEVEGALVYDPRKDSTVGGSGTHRYNDQTTWQYSPLDSNGVPIGRNNALQVLWYLLGWRIADTSGNQVLVAGRGVDPNDIDFTAFIAAANDCETQGFYTDCILSTGDAHQTNEGILTCDGALGVLIDPGGLWTYKVNRNDTGTVDVALTDDHVVDAGSIEWVPSLTMAEQFNSVAGTYVDPSSLYQPLPYPIVKNAAYETADGFKKRKTANYQSIQSAALAQKVSTLTLNAGRWQGVFTATFNFTALKTALCGIVTLTLAQYQFTSKLFRVLGMTVSAQGVELRLGEVDPSIWTAGSTSSPVPIATGGNGSTSGKIALTGFTASASAYVSSDGGTYPSIAFAWSTPPSTVRYVQVAYRPLGTTAWTYGPSLPYTEVGYMASAGLLSNTTYEAAVHTFSTYGVWSDLQPTTPLQVVTGGFVPPPTSVGGAGPGAPDGNFTGGVIGGITGSGSYSKTGGMIKVVSN